MNVALDVTLYILSALAGLAVGSFLNVCIYRLPRGKFFSKSRSYCPKCGAQIKAYDNIPLFSYIILRGKCRNCKERISPRYPFVEALTCALWVGNYATFGLDGMTIVWDIAVAVLIVAAFVDLDTFEIPDSGIITLLVLGLITFAPFGGVSWQDKLIGCVCVSVPMLIVCLFGGMGFGDVKLYFVLGLLLGWKKILIVFLLSVVLGAVVSVGYLIVCRRRESRAGDSTDENAEKPTTENYATEHATLENENAENAMADKEVCIAETAAEESVSADLSVVAEQTSENCAGTSSECDAQNSEKEEETRGHMIPFGPFIAIATAVTIYCGDAIIAFYSNILGI